MVDAHGETASTSVLSDIGADYGVDDGEIQIINVVLKEEGREWKINGYTQGVSVPQ